MRFIFSLWCIAICSLLGCSAVELTMDKGEAMIDGITGVEKNFTLECIRYEEYHECYVPYPDMLPQYCGNGPDGLPNDRACTLTLSIDDYNFSNWIYIAGYRKDGEYFPYQPWMLEHEHAEVDFAKGRGPSPD